MSDLVNIGKIIKSSGVKGSLKVLPFVESTRTLESLGEIFIGATAKTALPFQIAAVRRAKRYIMLALEEVNDAIASNALAGFHLYIPSERLDALQENEYYWRDILGLDVVTEEGLKLGKVEKIIPTGGNDVYVCAGGEREILIPAIENVIKMVDIERGLLVVRLLEGL